jgi:hypothetical protein
MAEQARRAVLAEDAVTILPPATRYTDPEVRNALAEPGVDGVLLITVADTGVVSQYAGTIFQASYRGPTAAAGSVSQWGTVRWYNERNGSGRGCRLRQM